MASAAPAATELRAGLADAVAGRQASVPLALVTEGDAVALQVDVVHPLALTLQTPPSRGAALAATDHEVHAHAVASGRLRVLVVSRSNRPLPGGVIASLPFALEPQAVAGDELALTLENAEIVDAAPQVLPGIVAHGAVRVVDCLLGDVHPLSSGDGLVDLRDLVAAHRALADGGASDLELSCCDAWPGTVACSADRRHWCAVGDGVFDDGDASALRRLVAGIDEAACFDCVVPEPPRERVIPGDVSPRGAPDGRVNVSDVVQALRWSVGLDGSPSADELVRADVAPTVETPGGAREVRGDGAIDIGDVVSLLRASVALEELVWRSWRLSFRLANDATLVAWRASLSLVPSHADAPAIDGDLADWCETGPGSGLDARGGTWAVACMTGADPQARSGELLTLVHRAPTAIDLTDVVLESVVVGANLELVDVDVEVINR